MTRVGLVLSMTLLAGAAAAQDHPVWPPTKDATVTYALEGSRQPQGMPTEMTMAYSAAQQKMRMDVAQGMYTVTDFRTKAMQMVMPEQKMIMTMGADSPAAQQMFDPSKIAKATKKGTDTVAGESCTVWDMAASGTPGEACITADGIMLRAASGSGQGMLRATKVVYGTIPASQFAMPPGYQTMQMPSGAGRPARP